MLRLPPETPLVGFHGKANGEVLTSLGLIMVNTDDDMCLHTSPHNDQMRMYQNMNEYEASAAAENSITYEEKERAAALEAIILYDSLVKARQSQQEIKQLIESLERRSPVSARPES